MPWDYPLATGGHQSWVYTSRWRKFMNCVLIMSIPLQSCCYLLSTFRTMSIVVPNSSTIIKITLLFYGRFQNSSVICLCSLCQLLCIVSGIFIYCDSPRYFLCSYYYCLIVLSYLEYSVVLICTQFHYWKSLLYSNRGYECI